MTIADALRWGRQQLAALPNPAGNSRQLLSHILGVQPSYLVAHGEMALPGRDEQSYRALVQRAANHEPIPYLLGYTPFYDSDFIVSPAVLIPRPETEQLVELVIGWAKQRGPLRLVDVGTGSGCIALTLAGHLPQATIEASDISAEALAVAAHNAKRLGRLVTFHHGHLLQPITGRVEAVVANLPYIADDEWTIVDDGVKWYEPAGALRGGPKGLDLIQQLLQQAIDTVNQAIFLEIGWQQGLAVQQLAQQFFPTAKIEILPDFAGRDRFVTIFRPDNANPISDSRPTQSH